MDAAVGTKILATSGGAVMNFSETEDLRQDSVCILHYLLLYQIQQLVVIGVTVDLMHKLCDPVSLCPAAEVASNLVSHRCGKEQ